jgi:5-methylthioadenosine/S-adenosylhomocysteine deaminase
MMDAAGADVPSRLREHRTASLDESLALRKRWHGAADGRIRTALAPRFAVSCSRELLESVGAVSAADRVLVHTHASESKDELSIVHEISGGLSNIAYLDSLRLATPHLCAAHCVWVDAADRELLAERDVKVMHCPGSNLKLGSGVAPVVEMRQRGVTVSLGADGAACNNRLDMFEEMRLAAVLQTARLGPGSLPARDVLWMATRGGARTLGLDNEIGSVEVGKKADLMLVDRGGVHVAPDPEPYSTLVYAARGSDVRITLVDGELLVDGGQPTRLSRSEVVAEGARAARQVATRAGV